MMKRASQIAMFLLLVIRTAPIATADESFNGLWLTDLGLMDLQQSRDQVIGAYALRGVSKIQGTVTDYKLTFTYNSFRTGSGSFELSPDGKTFAGQYTPT